MISVYNLNFQDSDDVWNLDRKQYKIVMTTWTCNRAAIYFLIIDSKRARRADGGWVQRETHFNWVSYATWAVAPKTLLVDGCMGILVNISDKWWLIDDRCLYYPTYIEIRS